MQTSDNGPVFQWQRIAQRLRAELGDDLFNSWFGRMEIDSQIDGRLVVSVPTRFLKSWIENHYLAKLHKTAETELGPLQLVNVRVRSSVPHMKPQANAAATVRPRAASATQDMRDGSMQAFLTAWRRLMRARHLKASWSGLQTSLPMQQLPVSLWDRLMPPIRRTRFISMRLRAWARHICSTRWHSASRQRSRNAGYSC
jgi:hypothetical protein